jgi:uroporphyrinogen decarboxylase
MKTININSRPDFNRFLDTLLLRKAYRRPPIFDFHVAPEHKAKVIGRPVKTPADDVEFWRLAGYDYIHCTALFIPDEMRAHKEIGTGKSHSSEIGFITSLDQFRGKRWSWQDVADGDLSKMQRELDWISGVAEALPPGMKIVFQTADVFTFAWDMIGFSHFCFMSLEEPEFIRAVMDSLAAAMLNVARAGMERAGNKLGAVFYSDDIAYTEGLMLSPDFFAEFLFPHIEQYGKLGAARGVPLLYHSDGKLYDVFDHLARIGVRGIQPLEPKSMDPVEIKRRWPGKFCLCGNIDLDLLARGTLAQVEKHVRDKIDRLNVGGGYMPGVSNTVPYYVNFDNYKQMIETVYSYEA